MELVYSPVIGQHVRLRSGTSDRQVWADTFTGLYHVPPRNMPTPNTVLDLGANIGLTAAHYQAMWPGARIVAVEMDEECAALAKANAPMATVLNVAVWGADEVGTYDPTVRAEAFRFSPGFAQPGPLTKAVSLRYILGEHFPVGADFVKMDVEGAEWDIFTHDNWRPLVRHLLVELHPVEDMPDDSDFLVEVALNILTATGMHAARHTAHPRAVWAWQ